MSQALPWDDIPVPNTGINRRLAAASMLVPASWAVDVRGRRLFILELEGDHSARYLRNALRVTGLNIDLRVHSPRFQMLVLTLESEQNVDLFYKLCDSLLSELASVATPASALEKTLSHLRRWKAFLSGNLARLLSSEEARGLFAEIWFLLQLTESKADIATAVSSWKGPDRLQQDFIFGDQAVEVKSLVATDPRTVRISSEDQLDSVQTRLYLLLLLLKESQDQGSRSLNQIVAEAHSLLAKSDASFEFDSKLAAYGYVPLREYDHPSLIVVGEQSYTVRDSFPRIIRQQLPNGVFRVRYQIQIEHLEPFRCGFEEVIGKGT